METMLAAKMDRRSFVKRFGARAAVALLAGGALAAAGAAEASAGGAPHIRFSFDPASGALRVRGNSFSARGYVTFYVEVIGGEEYDQTFQLRARATRNGNVAAFGYVPLGCKDTVVVWAVDERSWTTTRPVARVVGCPPG